MLISIFSGQGTEGFDGEDDNDSPMEIGLTWILFFFIFVYAIFLAPLLSFGSYIYSNIKIYNLKKEGVTDSSQDDIEDNPIE